MVRSEGCADKNNGARGVDVWEVNAFGIFYRRNDGMSGECAGFWREGVDLWRWGGF